MPCHGSVVLLAENQDGLSGALQMFVERKMKNKDLDKNLDWSISSTWKISDSNSIYEYYRPCHSII